MAETVTLNDGTKVPVNATVEAASAAEIAAKTEKVGETVGVSPAEFARVSELNAAWQAEIPEAFRDRQAMGADGNLKWEVPADDARGKGLLREMRREYVAAATALSHKVSATRPTVTMVHPSGRVAAVPAHLEAQAASKGFRSRVTGRRKRLDGQGYDPSRPLRTRDEIAGLE